MNNLSLTSLKKSLFIFTLFFAAHFSVKASAIIEVSFINTPYGSWTPNAKNSFLKAMNIWEKTLTSTQIIHVTAKWEDLSAANDGDVGFDDVLGYARPTTEVSNFGSNDQRYYSSFFYPLCLAEKLKGNEIRPDLFSREIECSFNSNGDFTWYFGLDGNCPVNQYDLVTVVMHEIGHGIGFFSGAFETDYFNPGTPYAGFEKQFIYDKYIKNSSGVGPLDFMPAGNFAPTSDSYLTSDDLFFTGNSATWNVTWSNQQIHPAIYAPISWETGSSISHFDEYFFFSEPNSGNHLMTPYTANGEAHHDPGYVGLGLLQDIGWDGSLYLGSEELVKKEHSKIQVYPNPCTSFLNIRSNESSKIEHVRILNLNGAILYQSKSPNHNTSLINLPPLSSGVYIVEVQDDNNQYFKELIFKQ